MVSTEPLKRLVYGQLLHFLHLNEQVQEMEQSELAEQARELGLAAHPNNLTIVHVIACIGSNEPINNTSIADKMKLSKASITKISAKLLEEGYVKRSRLNDNNKEVYFSLTPKGKYVYEAHEKMHEVLERKFIGMLDSFAEPELQAVLKFFQTMGDHLNKWQSKGAE